MLVRVPTALYLSDLDLDTVPSALCHGRGQIATFTLAGRIKTYFQNAVHIISLLASIMASSEETQTPDDLSSGNHSTDDPSFSPGDTPSDDSITEEMVSSDQADPPPVRPAASFRDEVRPEAIIHEPRRPSWDRAETETLEDDVVCAEAGVSRTNAPIHADNEDPDELDDEWVNVSDDEENMNSGLEEDGYLSNESK